MLDNFKSALFEKALAAGFSDCEIYCKRGRTFESHVFESEVRDYKNSSFIGLSFRGTYNGKMGYAYTERIEPDVMGILIQNAIANAEIIEDTDIERLYHGGENEGASLAAAEVSTYFPELEEVTQEEKIAAAKTMERAVLDYDPRIKSAVYCMVGTAGDEIYIANTYGLELTHRRNFALAYVYPQAEENGAAKLAGELWYGGRWEDFSPKALAEAAARKALSYLNAEQVKSGKYRILLSNEMAVDLFKVYTGAFFAENVQKGFSLLKDKLGTVVASPVLTLRDDGVCEKSLGSIPFDAEGVATQNKAVIEKGVLQTYLYTMKSAARDSVQPTGNGFKNGIHGAITTACTNFYVQPSNKTFDDMLSELENGIYITELEGLHSGTNAISGDFSVSASGFVVECGKIIRSVEQITIAGNFYRVLMDVIDVGGDLRFDMPGRMGTVGAPSILLGGLDVSGL